MKWIVLSWIFLLQCSFAHAKQRCFFDKKDIYHCHNTQVHFDSSRLYRDGLAIEYFSKKRIKVKGAYKLDRKHGEWVEYNQRGKILKKSYYFYGMHCDEVTEYQNKGTVSRRFSYPKCSSFNSKVIKEDGMKKRLRSVYQEYLLSKKKQATVVKTLLVLRQKKTLTASYLLKENGKLQFVNVTYYNRKGSWRL
jgi:hypothetical protein